MKKEKTKILRERYAGSYAGKRTKVKSAKIKPLPVVKMYALYWLRRARRVLQLKQSEEEGK